MESVLCRGLRPSFFNRQFISPVIFHPDQASFARRKNKLTHLGKIAIEKIASDVRPVGHKPPPNLVETLPGTVQDSCMTGKSTTEGKKRPAVKRVGVNKRAKAAAAVSSPVTKKVKTSPKILTEDARYELARKEAEARIVRHDLRDRQRGRP